MCPSSKKENEGMKLEMKMEHVLDEILGVIG
jgi:hypothetical protein